MTEKVAETTTEAVENGLVEELSQTHIVKQERTRTFNKRFGWATDYNKEKFEESRSVAIPADTPYNAIYVHELLTQADLTHMVIFNAHNQGYMKTDEFTEVLKSTVQVLRKATPYMKEVKEMGLEQYEEIASIYARLKQELEDENILKSKKAKSKGKES